MSALTQAQIDTINSINQEFQNLGMGDLLAEALGGEQPALSIAGPEIANGAIDNTKLATDVKVGSLAALTTSSKASVQSAINELVAAMLLKVDETSEIKNMFSQPYECLKGSISKEKL